MLKDEEQKRLNQLVLFYAVFGHNGYVKLILYSGFLTAAEYGTEARHSILFQYVIPAII